MILVTQESHDHTCHRLWVFLKRYKEQEWKGEGRRWGSKEVEGRANQSLMLAPKTMCAWAGRLNGDKFTNNMGTDAILLMPLLFA